MEGSDRKLASTADGRASEARLDEIRRQAELHRPKSFSAAPDPSPSTGYYGLPVVKEPQWKWEVPAYLFTGGAAGAAAVIAGAGSLCGANPCLVRDARRLAAICGGISPA